MPDIYAKIDDLEGTLKVGTKQCVALIIHYSNAPSTAQRIQGLAVLGDLSIAKGTAIATFVGGRYKSLGIGNHAAYYISQDAGGIWIMDQWASDSQKPMVSERYLRRKGRTPQGAFVDPSNNAEA